MASAVVVAAPVEVVVAAVFREAAEEGGAVDRVVAFPEAALRRAAVGLE